MIECEFRHIDGDMVLGSQNLETVPADGDEVIIEGAAYQVVGPKTHMIADSAVVYVRERSS